MFCCQSKAVMASVRQDETLKPKRHMLLSEEEDPTECISERSQSYTPIAGAVPSALEEAACQTAAAAAQPLGTRTLVETHASRLLQVDDYGVVDPAGPSSTATNTAAAPTTTANTVTASSSRQNQLQSILHSIDSSLVHLEQSDGVFSKVFFEPQGCIWKCQTVTNDKENQKNNNDSLLFVTLHASLAGHYVVRASMARKPTSSLAPKSKQPPKLTKSSSSLETVLDKVQWTVHKAVMRLEFPSFPGNGLSFKRIYQLNIKIKSGTTSTVYVGTHRSSDRKVAVKCIRRKVLTLEQEAEVYTQVALWASLQDESQNPARICPLLDFFEESDCYYLVMKLARGGTMLDRMPRGISRTRTLVQNLLQGLASMHARGICHGALEPKNVLFTSLDHDTNVQWAHLDRASRVEKSLTNKQQQPQGGNLLFMAPEVLVGQAYNQASDMWSVGCILFVLLSGDVPFWGRHQRELLKRIVQGHYDLDELVVSSSEEETTAAKDLIQRLLVPHPDHRLTASQALQHEWFQQEQETVVCAESLRHRFETFPGRMASRDALRLTENWVQTAKEMKWNHAPITTRRGGETVLALPTRKLPKITEHNDNCED